MEIRSIIDERKNNFQSFNPYESKDAVLLWAYAIYRYRMEREDTTATASRRISTRRDNPKVAIKNQPRHFQHRLDEINDQNVPPLWEISRDQLNKAYDKARFDRYLNDIDRHMNRKLYNKFFKRRIPWLYPDDGNLPKPSYLVKV